MGIKWKGSLAHGVLGVVGAGVACTEQGEAALPALAAVRPAPTAACVAEHTPGRAVAFGGKTL